MILFYFILFILFRLIIFCFILFYIISLFLIYIISWYDILLQYTQFYRMYHINLYLSTVFISLSFRLACFALFFSIFIIFHFYHMLFLFWGGFSKILSFIPLLVNLFLCPSRLILLYNYFLRFWFNLFLLHHILFYFILFYFYFICLILFHYILLSIHLLRMSLFCLYSLEFSLCLFLFNSHFYIILFYFYFSPLGPGLPISG